MAHRFLGSGWGLHRQGYRSLAIIASKTLKNLSFVMGMVTERYRLQSKSEENCIWLSL
jgi:hypothetical protein